MSHRVLQLSDTHFLEEGEDYEGSFAYDTAEAFEAVLKDIEAFETAPTFVAVTGDVADHGRAGQYRRAAAAFARLPAPVNACPGNHDQHAIFSSVGRPTVSTSRVVRVDDWCHLFVDSNAGILRENANGHLVDPDTYEERLHVNGMLGARESTWIREQVAATDAEHVFIWLHHPPEPTPAPLCLDQAYTAEWLALLPDMAKVRGLGAGHSHVPAAYELAGVPVFMAPSFKNNFDLQARTLLPPGYRVYDFGDDGSVGCQVRLVGEDRWPRHPYGRAVHALLMGEITFAEFDEISRRKQAS